MCDPECSKRFQAMEIDLVTISTDIKWIKGMCGICAAIVCTVAGIDISGVI